MQHDEGDHEQDGNDAEHLHPARHRVVVELAHARDLSIHCVSVKDILSCGLRLVYARAVPKLWNDTIEAHRREVRDAILDTTASLITRHGLDSVTMSQIADETGIGRATLYKYFPDIEAVLVAWHERQVANHLEELAAVRDRSGDAVERLEAVLDAFAVIAHERHGSEFAALLHRGSHVARAHEELARFVRDLIAEGVKVGALRDDVAPQELASYCLHALTAASGIASRAAVRRLVKVTLAGLLPPR